MTVLALTFILAIWAIGMRDLLTGLAPPKDRGQYLQGSMITLGVSLNGGLLLGFLVHWTIGLLVGFGLFAVRCALIVVFAATLRLLKRCYPIVGVPPQPLMLVIATLLSRLPDCWYWLGRIIVACAPSETVQSLWLFVFQDEFSPADAALMRSYAWDWMRRFERSRTVLTKLHLAQTLPKGT